MADPETIFTAGGMKFTTDDLADIDGIEARDFRQAVGMSVAKGFQALAMLEADLEVAAGFIWIMKRRENEHLTYPTVLKSVKFGDLIPADEEEETEEGTETDDVDPPTDSDGASASGGPSSPTPSASVPGRSTSSPPEN